MGGVYTPGVSQSFERVPFDNYTLTISYNCKPADLDTLEQATRRVIAETKQKGADESYITKLVNQRTVEVQEYYRSNTFWLQRLAVAYQRGEDPREILQLHELTKRVTSDNIKRAAQKYLKDTQYLDARLLPESSPETPSAPAPAPRPTAK
jgi:zinc protease